MLQPSIQLITLAAPRYLICSWAKCNADCSTVNKKVDNVVISIGIVGVIKARVLQIRLSEDEKRSFEIASELSESRYHLGSENGSGLPAFVNLKVPSKDTIR